MKTDNFYVTNEDGDVERSLKDFTSAFREFLTRFSWKISVFWSDLSEIVTQTSKNLFLTLSPPETSDFIEQAERKRASFVLVCRQL
jgi:hypothetical protein